jgi:hypothetical protein
VDRLTVRQQDNSKIPVFHLWHSSPAPNPAIRPVNLMDGRPNSTLDPCVLDKSPIRAQAHHLEVRLVASFVIMCTSVSYNGQ